MRTYGLRLRQRRAGMDDRLGAARASRARTRAPGNSLAAGGGAVAVGVLAIAWWRGSSPSGLWHGIVLDPLRLPGAYSFAVEWRTGTVAVALGSLALAGATRLPRRWWPTALAGLRLLIGAAFLAGALKTHNLTMPRVAFCYGVALAWMLSVPLQDGPATGDPNAPAAGWPWS